VDITTDVAAAATVVAAIVAVTMVATVVVAIAATTAAGPKWFVASCLTGRFAVASGFRLAKPKK
jgi:hypothetical protein